MLHTGLLVLILNRYLGEVMKTTATWYFDIISPYAYLQSKQLRSFSEQLNVSHVPVLFAGLLNHWGQLGPAEIEPKRQFIFRQAAWRAERLNITFRMPPSHPFNPLWALRLIAALGSTGQCTQTVFDHIWAEGHGLIEDADKSLLAEKLGMTLKQANEASQEPANKQAIINNTTQAAANGVFGVPSFVVDEQIFWGDDSHDMLQDWLSGKLDFDSELMRSIDTTKPSATRR